MLDPTTRGGGGTTRSSDPRDVMKMDITKSSMDIVENRNVKPMQAHRQSTRTTVTKVHTNFADIPKPTLSQRPAVTAEEARTVGTVNV